MSQKTIKQARKHHVQQMYRTFDSYFTLRIKGAMYGIWNDDPLGWTWEPVDGPSNWRYTEETNTHIQTVCDMLNKCPDYAGLTPQQFVEQLLK